MVGSEFVWVGTHECSKKRKEEKEEEEGGGEEEEKERKRKSHMMTNSPHMTNISFYSPKNILHSYCPLTC